MNAGQALRVALLAAAMLSGMAAAKAPAQERLLPTPQRIEPDQGSFKIAGAAIAAADLGARAAGERLAKLIKRSSGKIVRFSRAGSIRFIRDATIAGEGAYRLVIDSRGITVSARGDAGLFYGAQTLWQLIAAETDGTLKAQRIEDAPAYAWRGVMLDSARHMQPVDFIKELLDRMALVRLNKLHWHLTDDQGWRIPVPGYPRLTGHGGCRQPAGLEGIDPANGDARLYCGHYSAAQIREVVAYAAARHIEVVPEIDFPGHFTAAIAAYPWLASTANPPARPSASWGIHTNLMNPDERGMRFARDVLDEVMRLFPGRFIHIGGDEAVKDQWNENPAIQAQIRALGLKNAHALQGWIVAQLGAHAAKQGRRIVGWDEILDAEVTGDAVVMSWRGASGALAAARAGHDAILAPAPEYYMDNRQSASDAEPSGRGEVVSWKRLYEFDAGLSALSVEERRRILGMQVNLWTEHVRLPDYARNMLWPRAAVLGELGWSGAKRTWDRFGPDLLAEMQRQSRLGYASSTVSLDPDARFRMLDSGMVVATIDQPARIGTVHFTTDGSSPGTKSPRYVEPITIPIGTRLRAAALLDGRPISKPQEWLVSDETLRSTKGNALESCSNGVNLRMEDDAASDGERPAHVANIFETCWRWPAAPLAGMTRIRAAVAKRPFNFELAHDVGLVKLGDSRSATGELVVRQDNCNGPELARLPFDQIASRPGINAIEGRLKDPAAGPVDLCISIARPNADPMWVLDRLTLLP